MTEGLLMIFVKNLIPGEVKTRLAAEIGIYQALGVYEALVEHTRETVEQVKSDRAVFYSNYLETGDYFGDGLYKRALQEGDGLGARMSNSFDRAFNAGYKKAILIGSDCPSLSSKHLEEALKALDTNDLVVGPAKDGGYYLIGMKAPQPALFLDKTYSHDQVLKELLAAAKTHNLRHQLLEELTDIDTLADLEATGFDIDP